MIITYNYVLTSSGVVAGMTRRLRATRFTGSTSCNDQLKFVFGFINQLLGFRKRHGINWCAIQLAKTNK
jgi:hypothetical protein